MVESESSPTRVPLVSSLSRPYRVLLVISLTALASLLSACGALRSDDDTSEFWSPFSSQSTWEVGDGRIRLELNGFERGHEPGRTAEFTVDLENRRDQPTDLLVCAQLIDEDQVVQEFDQFAVHLEPDENQSTTFEAAFDEEIELRAYGLAVVVGDLGAVIHTVRVGIPDDEAGPWLDADELVCNG